MAAENHLPSCRSQNLILAVDFFEKTPNSDQEEDLSDCNKNGDFID